MTTIYVVAGVKSGYCNEDPGVAAVVGAWSNKNDAEKVRMIMGTGYIVSKVELDYTPAGIRDSAKELFDYSFRD
jgi:hypothetical protein